MSACVDTIRRHRAVCLECNWWGMEVESQEAAELDALEHDEAKHL